jgi:hypothetical protein
MLRALFARHQEVLYIQKLVYFVRIMWAGTTDIIRAVNIPNFLYTISCTRVKVKL